MPVELPDNNRGGATTDGMTHDAVPHAAAWRARAAELADWSLDRLAVRNDRYGGYVFKDGALVKRNLPKRGAASGALSREILHRHFSARSGLDVIGLHSIAPGTNTGRAAFADIDAHSTDDCPVRNLRYAEHLYHRLHGLSFHPLAAEYGEGSLHVGVLFDVDVPGDVLHALGEWIVSDAPAFGFAKAIESFPKQAMVPAEKYGNWLRLVGRHHKRDVWAKVFSGTRWLEGADAVAHILSLTGDPPNLIPAEARPAPLDPSVPPDRAFPLRGHVPTGGYGDNVFEAYRATVTLDDVVQWLERHGHRVVRRSADRVDFCRSGKEGAEESFNVKLIDGVPVTFCFSTNAGLPSGKGLGPVKLRCFLMYGACGKDEMRKLAAVLKEEMGWTAPRRKASVPPKLRVIDESAEADHINEGVTPTREESEPAETASADEPPEPPEPPEPAILRFPLPEHGEAWTDPHRLARLFVAEDLTPAGERTVLQHRDIWLRWRTGAWRPWADSDLDAELMAHIRRVFEADLPHRAVVAEYTARQEGKEKFKAPVLPAVSTKLRNDVRANLAGLVNLEDDGRDPPYWLSGASGDPSPFEVIAAPNGLFSILDTAQGNGPFAEPTPRFFTFNALPFNVGLGEQDAPAIWTRCLEQWFSGDAQSILGLQEWLGYLLSADTSLQKVLLLVGPPRSGKGTILNVLTDLVGHLNVASTTFAALGEDFGLESLLGKRVALIPDARLSGRTEVAAVIERLLSISGDDAQTVNRKFRPRITTKLRTRFVLASNEVPSLPDASGALASRFHILSLPNSFLGKEDTGLKDKLRDELPAILAWAARGYVRLKRAGAFTANAAAEQYRRELEELASPIKAFAAERCKTGPDLQVRVSELFSHWKDWNLARNSPPGTEGTFGRNLHAAFPAVRTTQPRVDGMRVRYYCGIALKPRAEWGDE